MPVRWQHSEDREEPVVITWTDVNAGLYLALVFFIVFVLPTAFQVP